MRSRRTRQGPGFRAFFILVRINPCLPRSIKMRLLRRKYLLRADVGHVVRCFTDLDYIHGVMTNLCEEEKAEIRIEKRGDALYFAGKEPLLKMTKFSAQRAHRFTSELVPISEQLKRFGNITIS